MYSCPRPALGFENSSKPGAAPPKGKITPGAVKYVEFGTREGVFVGPDTGARRIVVARRLLPPGQTMSIEAGEDAEHVIFVWRGALELTGRTAGRAEAKDAVFACGAAKLTLRNPSKEPAEFIHASTPPDAGREK